MTDIQKARISLEGLSVGDAFGERFFGPWAARLIERRELPEGPWRWTDDTHMALSIFEVLQAFGEIRQEALARRFAERFIQDKQRGYGPGTRAILEGIYQGEDWRPISGAVFQGGSFGNGAAMRAAPIGGFFAGDLERACEEARLSAEITHAHPEGQAGAMAVAVAASLAAADEGVDGADFLAEVLKFCPAGMTYEGLQVAMDIPASESKAAASRLGTGQRITAQDTVPFCIWVAAHHVKEYEEALWKTVAGLGDRDTTCAIVGGIVALSAGQVPAGWLERREPLPL